MTEAQKLAAEYRHTMPAEVLHLWAPEATAELLRLEAECEALRAKAARYDWLREKMLGALPLVRVLKMTRGTYTQLSPSELDVQTDAAMGKEQSND